MITRCEFLLSARPSFLVFRRAVPAHAFYSVHKKDLLNTRVRLLRSLTLRSSVYLWSDSRHHRDRKHLSRILTKGGSHGHRTGSVQSVPCLNVIVPWPLIAAITLYILINKYITDIHTIYIKLITIIYKLIKAHQKRK